MYTIHKTRFYLHEVKFWFSYLDDENLNKSLILLEFHFDSYLKDPLCRLQQEQISSQQADKIKFLFLCISCWHDEQLKVSMLLWPPKYLGHRLVTPLSPKDTDLSSFTKKFTDVHNEESSVC